MRKTQIVLLILILIGLNSCAQDLTCSDFKNGTFIIPNKYGELLNHKLIRNENSQMEFYDSTENKKINYGTVEWINDCSYRLKFDETKMDLRDDLKYINKNGGIITEMTKIEGKCFYYKSVLIVDGKVAKRIDGSFCKE
ncbi:hypothetical protein [uncultured Lacinutrix sp.]|uniref:hypothetical protein n=1 Tax=uncultured Lacinutrix sp. TaxID=574032 RepID=UPI002631BBCC|nr:hypothetical protein [uncultured Lacinutrix sp.]